MNKLTTPYLVLLIFFGGVAITIAFADTVTIVTYPYTIQDNSANQRFVITGSGNVGIGTASPLGVIDVRGSGSIGNAVFIGGATTNTGNGIRLLGGATNGALSQIYTDYFSTEGPLALGTYSNRADQLYLATSGNVGIGTASPTQKLDVSGNIQLTGNIVSPNDICIGSC